MRLNATFILLVLLAGCLEKPPLDCLSCDDGNPCTVDRCVMGQCEHKRLSGPMEGCFGSGGCVEYTCVYGDCIPQKKSACCGNGVCEDGESHLSCPKDCRATCIDGIQNQAEQGIDCGGPCSPCEAGQINELRRLGFLRSTWYDSSTNYTQAVEAYNLGKNSSTLLSSAMQSYSDMEILRDLLHKTQTHDKYAPLKPMLNDTLDMYMGAIHNMALYLQSRDDRYRIASNRMFSDSLERDKLFVREYNRLVDEANTNELGCFNLKKDPSEEGVDCGGPCRAKCQATYNISKYVTVRVEGGPARLSMNISSPAIAYPPQQSHISSAVSTKPTSKFTDDEGNVYYSFDFDMPAYGVKEFEITETVTLSKVPALAMSDSQYFSSLYLIENDFSQMTDDICYRGMALKAGSNSTRTAQNIQDWMIKNIQYELNLEELGAESCFISRKGACDEHADLFISLSRCAGIPSRRVTGSLLNETQLSGHAWAEYYDGGWIFLDPSIKKLQNSFQLDTKHITACVGEGAYHCGIGYAYTYSGKKPRVDVKEQVYLT